MRYRNRERNVLFYKRKVLSLFLFIITFLSSPLQGFATSQGAFSFGEGSANSVIFNMIEVESEAQKFAAKIKADKKVERILIKKAKKKLANLKKSEKNATKWKLKKIKAKKKALWIKIKKAEKRLQALKKIEKEASQQETNEEETSNSGNVAPDLPTLKTLEDYLLELDQATRTISYQGTTFIDEKSGMRETQYGSEYFKHELQLLFESYLKNNGTYYKVFPDTNINSEEYIISNGRPKEFKKYELTNNGTKQLKTHIYFWTAPSLIRYHIEYKSGTPILNYNYNIDGNIDSYKRNNSKGEVEYTKDFTNNNLTSTTQYEYHSNGKYSKKTTHDYESNGILDDITIYEYETNGDREDRYIYDYNSDGTKLIKKEHKVYKDNDTYKEFIYHYDEHTGKKTKREYYKYGELQTVTDYSYLYTGTLDSIDYYSYNDNGKITFVSNTILDNQGNNDYFVEYYYYQSGYNNNDSGDNLRMKRKYYYFPGGKLLEKKKFYNYRTNGEYESKFYIKYNSQGELIYSDEDKYDTRGNKIKEIVHYDSNNGKEDKGSTPPSNSQNGSSDGNDIYSFKINFNTGVVSYYDKDDKLIYKNIRPKFIRETKEEESVAKIINNDLGKDNVVISKDKYDNLSEEELNDFLLKNIESDISLANKVLNLSEEGAKGFKDGFYEATAGVIDESIELGKTIILSSIDMIMWSGEYIGQQAAIGIYGDELDPETQKEIWGEVRSSEDIKEGAIGIKNSVIDGLELARQLFVDDLTFYNKYKEKILERLVNENGETIAYWAAFITGYQNASLTKNAANSTISYYTRKPNMLNKVLLKDLKNLRFFIYGGPLNKNITVKTIDLSDRYELDYTKLTHIINGDWKNGKKTKNGKGFELSGGLHSYSTVLELLNDGKIEIIYEKYPKTYSKPLSYSQYKFLPEKLKKNVKIKSIDQADTRWGLIKKKSLFPESWSNDHIASALKEAQENVKSILKNEGLPLKDISLAGKNWKDANNGQALSMKITKNGQDVNVLLGGKYKQDGTINFNIVTFYPE